MQTKIDYDVTNVIAGFLKRDFPERPELIKYFQEYLVTGPRVVQLLIAEIGQAAANQKLDPVRTIAVGVMYGMVIGILLEKDRTARKFRIH